MASIKAIYKGDYLSANSHNLYIIDLDTGEKLGLQGLPKELDYNPESKWAVQATPGRNNPHYHFVGSEDTIVLDLSWWAEEEAKGDVIARCKWLESASKADGYKNRPHIFKLHWGSMFHKAKWIITAAPYKMKDFDAVNGYRPIHATQQVTLKRYTPTNRTQEEINDWKS